MTGGLQGEIVQYIQMYLSSQAKEEIVYIIDAQRAINNILLDMKILERTISVKLWG